MSDSLYAVMIAVTRKLRREALVDVQWFLRTTRLVCVLRSWLLSPVNPANSIWNPECSSRHVNSARFHPLTWGGFAGEPGSSMARTRCRSGVLKRPTLA